MTREALKTVQVVGESSYGGATYLIIRWIRFLVQHGCTVDVVASDERACELIAEESGIRVLNGISIPRQIRFRADGLALCQLVRLFHRERYDVVHTYTATPGFLGRLAGRLCGVPAVIHHQAGWNVTEWSSLREKLIYWPLEYLATVFSTKSICVGESVKEEATRRHLAPPSKLVVIRNGIEVHRFAGAVGRCGVSFREEMGVNDGRLLVGVVSRLSERKGLEAVIEAFPRIVAALPDRCPTLLIAGDGPIRSSLERLAVASGAGDRIRFLGFQSDVVPFLDALDICVHPSLREGLSISLLEAMGARKAIVASAISANAELIKNGVTGLLFAPDERDELVSAVLRFADDSEYASGCGLRAQAAAARDYTIERMFSETWQLYLQLTRL